MSIHKIVARKKAGAKKKTNFFMCTGCFGIYAAGTAIQAPPNKDNLRLVCKSCFNQYIGSYSPVPSNASFALKNQYGSYMTNGGAGILSNANAGVISDWGCGLISNHSHGFISEQGGALIASNGGKLVGNDGAGLIGNDGST